MSKNKTNKISKTNKSKNKSEKPLTAKEERALTRVMSLHEFLQTVDIITPKGRITKHGFESNTKKS